MNFSNLLDVLYKIIVMTNLSAILDFPFDHEINMFSIDGFKLVLPYGKFFQHGLPITKYRYTRVFIWFCLCYIVNPKIKNFLFWRKKHCLLVNEKILEIFNFVWCVIKKLFKSHTKSFSGNIIYECLYLQIQITIY